MQSRPSPVFGANADVPPPGHGRVVEGAVVELLPLGSDVLLAFLLTLNFAFSHLIV